MAIDRSPRRAALMIAAPLLVAVAATFPVAGCKGDDDTFSPSGPTYTDRDGTIRFGEMGSLHLPEGRGSFRFGAATAATQIEDQNVHTDWYQWSLPVSEGGLGNGAAHVGDAVRSYTLSDRDIEIMQELGLETYRFSIEWARVEPQRDVIDEEALEHYSDFIDRLLAAGIRPMITLHHFSNPLWVQALGAGAPCGPDGPADDNLCGWEHPEGQGLIVEEMRQHAQLLAERFGDRVDDWCTLNEPVNYIIAGWGAGVFPPGRSYIIAGIGGVNSPAFQRLVAVFEGFLRAHVAMYDAITEHDTIDADGDGVAASIGMTLNVIEWEPVRRGELSDHPEDVAATERIRAFYHYLFVDSIRSGSFDRDFDGEADVQYPEWTGKLDWLGVQYYLRNGVTHNAVVRIPGVDAMICFAGFEAFGACLDIQDPTKWIPTMHYEYLEEGFYNIIMEFTERYPDLPLLVTEAGIAAENGVRRAENVVRTLEQVVRAVDDGADVRGYYHWSLTDNFEWAEGYEPRFGLYRVDFETYERTATEGATVYADIIRERVVTPAQRQQYGGTGPMTPELD